MEKFVLYVILLSWLGVFFCNGHIMIILIFFEVIIMGVFLGLMDYMLMGGAVGLMGTVYLMLGVMEGILGLSLMVYFIHTVGVDYGLISGVN